MQQFVVSWWRFELSIHNNSVSVLLHFVEVTVFIHGRESHYQLLLSRLVYQPYQLLVMHIHCLCTSYNNLILLNFIDNLLLLFNSLCHLFVLLFHLQHFNVISFCINILLMIVFPSALHVSIGFLVHFKVEFVLCG